MTERPEPTERELAILEVIWKRGEATVREVHEALRDEMPIVQNTVQAFLRTMTKKGLVRYRVEGRTFFYTSEVEPEATRRRLLERVWTQVYDGALDRLVAGALSVKPPTATELERLRELLEEVEPAADEAEDPTR